MTPPPHGFVGREVYGRSFDDSQTRRFVTQRHNELKELLNMICNNSETEPVLQDISGEHLKRRSNKAQYTRLDIHAVDVGSTNDLH